MDNAALLLPEPFSEKNIDGSPISKADEGRALFRKPARTAEPRSNPTPVAKRGYDDYGYEPPKSEPVTVRIRNEEPAYEPRQVEPASSDYARASYDTEKFEAPVDEKPGMIHNPLPMPPVKKKKELDYDYDYDSDIPDGDYGYGDEPDVSVPKQVEAAPSKRVEVSKANEPGGYDDYGGYDSSDVSADRGGEGAMASGDDSDYGSYDSATDDDYDADYSSDDGSYGVDSDYGTDYSVSGDSDYY